MEKNNFYCSFSPITILFIGYLFQAIEFLLIIPTFRYLFYHFEKLHFTEAIHNNLITNSFMLYYLGSILFNPFLASYSDFWGRRKTLIFAQTLRILSFFLCASGYFLLSLFIYFIGRLMDGISSSFASISLAAVSDLYENPLKRLKGYGLIQIINGSLMAFFFFSVVTAPHSSIDPVPSPSQIYFLCSIISLFVLFLILSNFSEPLSEVHSWKRSLSHLFASLVLFFKTPQIKLIYLIYFLFLYSSSCVIVKRAQFLYSSIGENGLLLLFFLFILIFGIASRFGVSFLFRKFNVKKIVLVSSILFIFLDILSLVSSTFSIPILLFFSLILGIIMPAFSWILGELAPQPLRGTAFGWNQSLWALAILLSFLYPLEPLPFLLIAACLIAISRPRLEISEQIK